jgi:hypothetical protein
MSTSYSIADQLVKDSGGAKAAMLVDLATSQLDWSLIAGIGTKIANGKNYSAMFSAGALAGSKLETAVVGDLMMGALTLNPSAISFGGPIPIRADDRGAVFTTSLSATTCAFVATSHDVVTTNSGILYRIVCATCGGVAGAQTRVMNGLASLTHVSYSQNSETVIVDFGPGACFGNLTVEKVNSAGVQYITPIYRSYGIG